ncbi:MAG: hypothetical protein VKN15_06515 [Cyanobacteriota bacterium]|nr:hypothetical protein [Cyanobacteriota bacterium]
MGAPAWIRTPPAPRRVVLAGLGQVVLLLLALGGIVVGPGGHDFLRGSALLALSLLPIGWGWRLPGLQLGAVGLGLLGLLLSWQRQRLGIGPDGVGSITILPLVLTSLAAAAGQWFNLGLLPLQRIGQAVRTLAQLAIVLCLLLLLTYLGGGAGVGVALGLLGVALADLALTALALILGAAGSRRGSRLS